MDRPTRFEHNRWVGDKRTQVVHDVDRIEDPEHLADLMEAAPTCASGPTRWPSAQPQVPTCRVCARPADDGAEP